VAYFLGHPVNALIDH